MDQVTKVQTVRLVVQTSPMDGKRVIHNLPCTGQSVGDLLREVGLYDTFLIEPDLSHIWINDGKVDPLKMDDFYPQPGDIVAAKLMPGVTAAIVTAITAGAVAGTTAVVVAAIVNIVLMVGISLLASLVFAPKIDDLDSAQPGSEALRLTGGRNRQNPFGKIPKIYGRWRHTPTLAAKVYTEVVGIDQYLRQAFLIGIGDYKLSDFRIGNTPFASYNDALKQCTKMSDIGNVEAPNGSGAALGQIHNVCVDFNGTNERLGNNNSNNLGFGSEGNHTISMWFKPQDLGTKKETLFNVTGGSPTYYGSGSNMNAVNFRSIFWRIVPSGGGVGHYFEIYMEGQPYGGQGGRYIHPDQYSAPYLIYRWYNIFENEKWYNLVTTYNNTQYQSHYNALGAGGTETNAVLDGLHLYVNGQFKSSTKYQNISHYYSQFFIPSQNMMFVASDRAAGSSSTSKWRNEYFTGRVHSLGIWDSELDYDNILQLYNRNAGDRLDLTINQGDYQSANSLFHYYRFGNYTSFPGKPFGPGPGAGIDSPTLDDNSKNISGSDSVIDSPKIDLTIPVEDGDIQDRLSLYPDSVVDNQTGLVLKDKYKGPEPIVRATAAATTGFSVSLLFAKGLKRINEDGKKRYHSVRIRMWYRRVGQEFGGDGTGGGGYTLFKDVSPSKQTVEPFYIHASVNKLLADTYEVKVQMDSLNPKGNYTTDRNGTGSDALAINGDASYTSLKSFQEGAPFICPDATICAMRIKATEQLTGAVEEFNMQVQSLIPTWTEAAGWSAPVFTRNPAWISLDILRGTANQLPVRDERIDLVAFKEWADFCDTNELTFDGIFDFKNNPVFNAVNTVARTGRASLQINGDIYSIAVDDPAFRPTPVQMFTARNSWNFKTTKMYPEPIHLIRVPFPNVEKDFNIDIAEVYNDGFDETNSTRIIESQEMRGLTEFDKVWTAVRFDMLTQRFRPEVFELECGLDVLVARRGDKVRISHYLLAQPDRTSARVAEITTDSQENIVSVRIDEKQLFELGETYACEVRQTPNSNFVDVGVDNISVGPDIYSDTLTFATLVAPNSIEVGDLLAFGSAELVTIDCVIVGITNKNDLTATMSLVDEAPEIQETLAGEDVPAFNSQINSSKRLTLTAPDIPVLGEVRRRIVGFGQDSDDPLVSIAVDIVPGQALEPAFTAPTIGYKAQYRENDPEDTTEFPVHSIAAKLRGSSYTDYQGGFRHFGPNPINIANAWTTQHWCRIPYFSSYPGGTVGAPNVPRIETVFEVAGVDTVYPLQANDRIQVRWKGGDYMVTLVDSTGIVLRDYRWDQLVNNVLTEWVQICMTWDGDDLRVYLQADEVLPDFVSKANVGGSGIMADSPRRIAVGSNIGLVNFLNNRITSESTQDLHSFAIWDSALTEDSIQKLFNGGSACDMNLAVNENQYVHSDSLVHWWRLCGTGITQAEAIANGQATWGADWTESPNPIDIAFDRWALFDSEVIDDAPCGVAPNVRSIVTSATSRDAEEGWITLPRVDVSTGQVTIPQIRSTAPFDLRVWALGPDEVQSEDVAFVTRKPIIGAAGVTTPTGFETFVDSIVDSQGARATMMFVWDEPTIADLDDSVSYIVRWNRAGDPVQTATIFIAPGDDYELEVDNPPGGIYSADLVAVDKFGQESEPTTLNFEFEPVIPIDPMKVTGLQQAQIEGSSGSTEVKGENFVIVWRKSINLEQAIYKTTYRRRSFGRRRRGSVLTNPNCGQVPLLKDYQIEVYSFFDDDATNGNDPLLPGTVYSDNLKKRGTYYTKNTEYTFDIATNAASGYTDTSLPSTSPKQPDRKIMFVVRMRDVNNNLSSPSIITLENDAPDPPATVIAVDVGSRQLGVLWNVETDDPDFRGVIIWAEEGDADFEAIGSNVGEGNVVFKGSESPAKWDAEPLNDDGSAKEYTVKIASYDAFPVVADKLTKVTV